MNSIAENLAKIKHRLNTDVNLLVVSKTRSVEEIQIAYDAGQREFGENKVQELLDKAQELSDLKINWHFIGHLQSNKINQLLKVSNLVSIHSIDSIHLLNKLIAKSTDKSIGVFLQFNTSGEQEKSGFTDRDQLEEAIKLLKNAQGFYLQGLMTIGKIRTETFEKDARSSFSQLQYLKEELDKSHDLNLELSMGMSQDFEIAQEYGSNWVRIGTDIFGTRD